MGRVVLKEREIGAKRGATRVRDAAGRRRRDEKMAEAMVAARDGVFSRQFGQELKLAR